MDVAPIIFWPVAKIAERDGVSRQAVSKQIRRLAEIRPDTPVQHDNRGRINRVSIAHYDQFRTGVVSPTAAFFGEIRAILFTLPDHAHAVATQVGRSGESGAYDVLRGLALKLNLAIETVLAKHHSKFERTNDE